MPVELINNSEDLKLNKRADVNNVLGSPPNSILTFGPSIILLFVLFFFILSWAIKYPDIVLAEATILTENPAIRVVALASGKVETLAIENNQTVKQGDLLAVLESPTLKKDILKLKDFLFKIERIVKPEDYLKIVFPESLNLGAIQLEYANLIQKINDYQYYIKSDEVSDNITLLKEQIKYIESLNSSLIEQQDILKQEVNIAERNYLRNKQLNKEALISDLDFEKIETVYLQYQRQLVDFQTKIINNKIEIKQIESKVLGLDQNRSDGMNSKKLAINNNIKVLNSRVFVWEQTYLITSPIMGKVSLSKIWSSKQFVKTGEELFTIIPLDGNSEIISRGLMPIANSGKVEIGQLVNIQLDGFPFQEFGFIQAKVQNISLIAEQEQYYIELELIDGLKTSFGKEISFRQEMKGVAKIVTEDKRILERIFEQFVTIFEP